jgi:hypothetical protein
METMAIYFWMRGRQTDPVLNAQEYPCPNAVE